MSGSVLHKNYNPPLPNFSVIALFYTWNVVFCKLQIREIHNLKQFKKITVISPRTEYDR